MLTGRVDPEHHGFHARILPGLAQCLAQRTCRPACDLLKHKTDEHGLTLPMSGLLVMVLLILVVLVTAVGIIIATISYVGLIDSLMH